MLELSPKVVMACSGCMLCLCTEFVEFLVLRYWHSDVVESKFALAYPLEYLFDHKFFFSLLFGHGYTG